MSKYVREIDSLDGLRDTPTSDAAAAHVRTPTGQSGVFVPMDGDPFGNGDDGGIALQATDGTWWVRKDAITSPINVAWLGGDEQALNTALSNFDTVTVPDGVTIRAEQEITLPEGTTLLGPGKIEFSPASDFQDAIGFGSSDDIRVEGLTVEHVNSRPGTNLIQGLQPSDSTTAAGNIQIINNTLINPTQHGVELSSNVQASDTPLGPNTAVGYEDFLIRGNDIRGAGSLGVILFGYCTDGIIANNRIEGSGSTINIKIDIFSSGITVTENLCESGIAVEGGSNNIRVSDNTAEFVQLIFGTYSTAAGANGEPWYTVDNVSVLNNTLTGSGQAGVRLWGHNGHGDDSQTGAPYDHESRPRDLIDDCRIENNTIREPDESGVWGQFVGPNTVIRNNQIVAPGQNPSSGQGNNGVYLEKSVRTTVENNDILNSVGPSIRIDGESSEFSNGIEIVRNRILNEQDTGQFRWDILLAGNTENIRVGKNRIETVGGYALRFEDPCENLITERNFYPTQPTQSYASILSGVTYAPGRKRSGIKRIDLGTSQTYLFQGGFLSIGDVDYRQIRVTDVEILYLQPDTQGGSATLEIGNPQTTDQIVSVSSLSNNSQFDTQAPAVNNSRVETDPLILTVTGGSTDAVVGVDVGLTEV